MTESASHRVVVIGPDGQPVGYADVPNCRWHQQRRIRWRRTAPTGGGAESDVTATGGQPRSRPTPSASRPR